MSGTSNSAAPASEMMGMERCVHLRADHKKPAVLLSGTIVNQNVRNAVRSLVEHEMLGEFWTLFSWNAQSKWNSVLPRSLRTQLAKRSFSEAPPDRVRSVPWREVIRVGVHGTRLDPILCSGERPFSPIGTNRDFDRRVARRVRDLRPDIVYGYEGCSLQTFREARRHGAMRCYELPSSFWHWERRFLSEEAERNPEFAGLLPKLTDSPGHMQWKDEELSLSDCVIVPSQHVRETLKGVMPEEKIRVINYGAPPVRGEKSVASLPNRPLKVLFVGALVQRKGISYVLNAVEKLGRHVELTLIGRRYSANAKVDEACRRWPWFESLPHSGVLDAMRNADVLVLASLAEGCALVVLEALSSGLPVIVTRNTGASDFVCDGREGFVVPVCQAEPIAAKLELLHRDREMLLEMSRQAQATAVQNSWEQYRAKLACAVGSLACP